jgi:uncharacterized protein (TIGR04255 family)
MKIDLQEQFPHLANAPIVEAVLHWRAAAGKTLEKAQTQLELTRRFPDYNCVEQQELKAEFQRSPEGTEFLERSRWDGFRLTGQGPSERYVAQFTPNGVVFSRLPKYDRWEPFEAEGLRFWDAYLELADPPALDRLGVRFINKIELGRSDDAGRLLTGLPPAPGGIALARDLFFHQDVFRITGSAYRAKIVQTVQPIQAEDRILIVDIDVSLQGGPLPQQEQLRTTLAEMRSIKNKLFFACMTPQAIARFGEDENDAPA